MSIVAVVSGAELNTVEWEVCNRGYSLASVPTKYLRVSVRGERPAEFWRGRPCASSQSYSVSVESLCGKYDGRRGILLVLSPTDDEPTGSFGYETIDRGDRFVKVVGIDGWNSGELPMLSHHPDIDPRRQLWWAWKHWYCHMVHANDVRAHEAGFVADCESLYLTVTERNRAASRLLYRLAREAGWRQLGRKFAAYLGLRAGAWITDEEFHRAGSARFGDWELRSSSSQHSEESANPQR